MKKRLPVVMNHHTYRVYPFFGERSEKCCQFIQHPRFVMCSVYQRVRRGQLIDLFGCQPDAAAQVLQRRTRHPIDQTSIRDPHSTLSVGEKSLKMASGARTCNGVWRF